MAGLQGLGLALKILESLVPRLGAASDAGKDVLKCITTLAKHVEAGGGSSQAGQRNELQNQMQRMQQMRQQMARPQAAAPATPQPTPGAAGGPAPAQAA